MPHFYFKKVTHIHVFINKPLLIRPTKKKFLKSFPDRHAQPAAENLVFLLNAHAYGVKFIILDTKWDMKIIVTCVYQILLVKNVTFSNK